MRVLAFSDLHRARSRAEALAAAAAGAADLVIGAGDFATARQGLAEALDPFSRLGAPFVAVPRNAESAGELAAAALPGALILRGSGARVAGFALFGLGHAVPPTPFGAWSCDLTEAEAAALLDRCAGCDILGTHAPPAGVALPRERGTRARWTQPRLGSGPRSRRTASAEACALRPYPRQLGRGGADRRDPRRQPRPRRNLARAAPMIDPPILLTLLPAALALNRTPGADMMFCLAQGARGGAPALRLAPEGRR